MARPIMRIDNDALFLDMADVLSRRTRFIGVRQVARGLNVGYGKVRSCIKAAKTKYGSNIFRVNKAGILLTEKGREVHRKLKAILVSRTNQWQARSDRPVVMVDPDLEAWLISDHQTASLLAQCRVVPINYMDMQEQLESGHVLLGLGLSHRSFTPATQLLRQFPFRLAVPGDHWSTIEGQLDVSKSGLCSSDTIAFRHGDERLQGVDFLLREIPEERRIAGGSYAAVVNHIIQGKIGLLPSLVELPTEHSHRIQQVALVGVEPLGMAYYTAASESDDSPPVVSNLIAAIQQGALT